VEGTLARSRDTSVTDILREISSKLDKLDVIAAELKELKASTLTRDRQFESGVSKLEVDVAKRRRT
jgi:hypothetical protein